MHYKKSELLTVEYCLKSFCLPVLAFSVEVTAQIYICIRTDDFNMYPVNAMFSNQYAKFLDNLYNQSVLNKLETLNTLKCNICQIPKLYALVNFVLVVNSYVMFVLCCLFALVFSHSYLCLDAFASAR